MTEKYIGKPWFLFLVYVYLTRKRELNVLVRRIVLQAVFAIINIYEK